MAALSGLTTTIPCPRCRQQFDVRLPARAIDPRTLSISITEADLRAVLVHVKTHRHPAIKPNRRRIHRRRS